MDRLGVDVRIGTAATLDAIKQIDPDRVIIATGVIPSVPPINGIEHALSAWDVLEDCSAIKENSVIAVLGGGDVGCETAVYLAKEKGCKAQIFEMTGSFATGSGTLYELMMELQEYQVNLNLNAKVSTVAENFIEYVKDNKKERFECDHVIASLGVKPYGLNLAEEIKNAGYIVRVVGEAGGEAKIGGAVMSGYNVAHAL